MVGQRSEQAGDRKKVLGPELLWLVVGVVLLGLAGRRQLGHTSEMVLVWPATSFAVTMLWRGRYEYISAGLLACFAAIVGVNLFNGFSPVVSVSLACVFVAETSIGLAMLTRLEPERVDRSLSCFLILLGALGLAMPMVGATLGATVLADLGGYSARDAWVSWFLGEMVGATLMLPLAVSFDRERLSTLFRGQQRRELLGISAFSVVLFAVNTAAFEQPTLLLVIPMLWAAHRLNRMATALVGTVMISTTLAAADLHHVVVFGPRLASGAVFAPWASFAVLLPYCIAVLLDELKSEREKISLRERYFRDAMHHSPIGMALLRPDGRCVTVNRALGDLLGWEPEELVGKTPSEVSLPEEAETTAARLALLVAGELDQYVIEKRFVRKDGQTIWTFLAVAAVRDEETGRAVYLVAQMQNIEARRRTEKALEESESRWNFALESAGQGVWDYDYRRGDTFYSPMWSRMLGYEPGEIATDTDGWLTIVHPQDLKRLLQQEKQHLSGASEQFECEFRMRHKDGRWLWILDRGKVIARDEEGHPLRMIGTHTDITEHRRLTEELEEEKERLRITLDSIGDGVICTDALGNVTFMNPMAETLTGWTASMAIGQPCEAVFRVADDGGASGQPCVVRECLTELAPVERDEGQVLRTLAGERLDVEAIASPVCKPSGELIGSVLVFQDVTRARTLQKQLAQMASHDALTGLGNRVAFEVRLSELCSTAISGGREHAIGFIDLDRFKIINDTAGHAAGDALLREIGRIVREHMRGADLVARLGGDEFAFLLVDCSLDDAAEVGERLLERIARVRFSWGGRVYEVGASMGIAKIDGETPLAADVMSRADVACYAAKAAGRSRVSVYHPSEGDARRHHTELHTVAGIRAALESDRFVVHAQEILDLRPSGALQRHAELLVRMVDEDGGLIMPGSFIPAAERYGLMGAIDRWVIREVLHRHGPAILAVPRLAVSINLSGNSLEDPGLLDFLAGELDRSVLPPHRIRFEITETSLINNIGTAGRLVSGLKSAGYAIMLDDFGAGVSSFSYLERFPADYIKIDGGFVKKLRENSIDRAIVESINDIGHKIGAITVAEFVEDEETLALIGEIGIDMAQGHHIARPIPIESFLRMDSPSSARSAVGG